MKNSILSAALAAALICVPSSAFAVASCGGDVCTLDDAEALMSLGLKNYACMISVDEIPHQSIAAPIEKLAITILNAELEANAKSKTPVSSLSIALKVSV